jgi:hypothetical protein
MPVKMISESSARGSSEIGAEIERRGSKRNAQALDRKRDQIGDSRTLFPAKQLRRTDVTPRRHHQMAAVVRIPVQHDKCLRSGI